MTARRTATSPTPTPALTSGDDQPRGNCHGLAARMAPDPTPFDVLTDLTAGPGFKAALTEARALCSTCPIWRTCLVQNRRETWAKAVITGLSAQQRAAAKRPKPVDETPLRRAKCGTASGEKRHRLVGEKPCGECREAARVYNREWRRKRKAAA